MAVATCLNFRQAAAQLHMTQPPLTRAIQRLEERLGRQLFARDTQRVSLTPAGEQLSKHARQILAMLAEAEEVVAASAGHARPLRLGVTASLEPGMFAALGQALAAALPAAPTLQFAPSPRLVTALRAGRLDAALIALPTLTFDLAVEPLLRQPLLAALPAQHALARRRRIGLADLHGSAVLWFGRARQPAFFDHCHAVFARHGCAPHFVPEPEDHHVLLADIAAGKGIALLPASFATLRRRGVVYRPLVEGEEMAVGLGLATTTERTSDPALNKLRELSREALRAPAVNPAD